MLSRLRQQGLGTIPRFATARGYRNIIVPIAPGYPSEEAIDVACRLAGRRAEIVAETVIEVPVELPLDAHLPEEMEEANRQLAAASAISRPYGVKVKEHIERARNSGGAIVEDATRRKTEIIVMSGPRRIRLAVGKRPIFGDTVDFVLKHAPCRVLVTTGREGPTQAPFSRILVPMKLGDIGEEMVATAVKLAQDKQSKVDALFVIKVPLDKRLDAPLPDLEQQAAASLAEAAALGSEHGVEVVGRTVRARAIGEAILEAAEESGADLIVLGSSPRWRRQSRFFSPTVDHVLRRASGEVLIVAFPQGAIEGPQA